MCHPSPRKFDCTRSYAETEIHGYTHGNVSGREIQEIPSKQGRKDSSSCRQGGGDGLGHKTHDEVVRTSGMMCPVYKAGFFYFMNGTAYTTLKGRTYPVLGQLSSIHFTVREERLNIKDNENL